MTTTTQADKDLIRQLFQSAAGETEAPAQVETVEYDFRIPCRFVPNELERLARFAAGAADRVARALGALVRTELSMSPAPVTQHYAADLRDSLAETNDCRVPLTLDDGRACGLIRLPTAAARDWIRQLLGGSGAPAEAEAELATVERGLLSDILAALAGAFSEALTEAGGPALRCADHDPSAPGELPGSDWDEYCRFPFRPSAGGQDAETDPPQDDAGGSDPVEVLILSEFVDGVVAGAPAPAAGRTGTEGRREDLMEHLAHMPLEITARLGSSQVPMRDVLALSPGDVLVTDSQVGEPVDLLVQGKVMLSGFPVRSSGRYALEIVGGGAGRPRESA